MIKAINNRTWLGIIFLLLLFLPHVGFLQIVNILISLFCYYKFHKNCVYFRYTKFMILCICVSFLLSVFSSEVELKSVLRATSLILYLSIFPFAIHCNLSNRVYFIAISIIFLSQLAYIVQYYPAINLMTTYFPTENDTLEYVERYLDAGSALSAIRFGGLYGNPNQAAKYIIVILISYMLDNKSQDTRLKLLFISISGIAVLLTGSRTGMGILLIAMLYSLLNKLNKTQKKIIFFAGALIVGYFLFFSAMETIESDYRGFAIKEGFNDSMSEKSEAVMNYFSDGNIFTFLFGCFWEDKSKTFMDSEWGDGLVIYGFFFCIAYVFFVVELFRKIRSKDRMVLLLMLWCISSTILFSYRASLLVLFVLSRFLDKRLLFSGSPAKSCV